jgi:hypothetical protein
MFENRLKTEFAELQEYLFLSFENDVENTKSLCLWKLYVKLFYDFLTHGVSTCMY